MRFICIFTGSEPPKGPPSPEHIAAMQAEIGKAVAAGAMVTTGGIGLREATGGRVRRDKEGLSVEAPPQGDGGWMAAGGFSIVNAESREALIEQLKGQLNMMGEGVVEFCEYKQFYPPADAPIGAAAPAQPRGVSAGVVPYLSIDGAADASAFYQKAFGAKELARMPAEDGKRLMHCQLEINGGSLMIADNFPEMGAQPVQRSSSYVMHLVVDDGDAWWKRAIDAGCKQTLPFERAFWGDRYGQFTDPFGVVWALVEPAKG